MRFRMMDALPVEHGFFATMANKDSEQSSLQQGEILVMDGIDQPQGGYVLRRDSAGTAAENADLSGAVPILGSPMNLEAKRVNLITFLCDFWSETDDLGGARDDTEFHAWIEYQPQFLFF
jgi:hypothetical protein